MVDQLLTVAEVAERLSITRRDTYRLIEKGEIPAKRLSPKRIRISELELRQWLETRNYSSATP